MKNKLFLSAVVILFALTLSAQRQYTVVKFNGDTLYFDELAAGGKTIVCKSQGKEKVKLIASEVSYYIAPYKIWIQNEGERKAHQIDTTKKCFVPADGRIYTVEIENDSVYLASIEKEINGMTFMDYHIFRKKDNSEILEIKEDKTAPETLKKYFGGSCQVFDQQIIEFRPKFQKVKFPYEEWSTLLYTYSTKCVK